MTFIMQQYQYSTPGSLNEFSNIYGKKVNKISSIPLTMKNLNKIQINKLAQN